MANPDAPKDEFAETGKRDARALAKRRHDIKAALRTMQHAIQALRGGYHFDDDKAAAKIDAMGRALLVLEREGEFILQVLEQEA